VTPVIGPGGEILVTPVGQTGREILTTPVGGAGLDNQSVVVRLRYAPMTQHQRF
jgi:hypothetical protein